MNPQQNRHPSSYRDPAGFVFVQEGVVYRQVNTVYREHYDHFIQSGLYDRLVEEALILPHEEIELPENSDAYKILRPKQLAFISYPYEWCHAQLQDAALLTLRILQVSLAHGMILKDATPYNIQFIGSKPVFVDTLSWACYTAGEPWVAYRQFCEMFLAPLAISHYCGQPVSRTLRAWPEGIPIEVASALLSMRSRFNLGILLHIHLQASISKQSAKKGKHTAGGRKVKPDNIIESLKNTTGKLTVSKGQSAWTNYYNDIEERGDYFIDKTGIIQNWLRNIGPVESMLDAGGNEGHFSRLMPTPCRIISIDADDTVVDRNYRASKAEQKNNQEVEMLPLVMDLCDLSAAQGLLNRERASLVDRSRFDLVLALAVIHHLLIGRQVPMNAVVELLSALSRKWLILEFVPMEDPWAQQLLEAKKGAVHAYHQKSFEQEIDNHFQIVEKKSVASSGRWLYKLQKKA